MHNPCPTTLKFSFIPGPLVTDAQLEACASLFSSNYGIWSSLAPAPLKPGFRIKMGVATLRDQCFADPKKSMLALCIADMALVGHAFATAWQYNGSNICWVTQLVVAHGYRQRGIATTLLHLLPGPDFECATFGLASSHPAACLALLKRTHANARKPDLEFIRTHAQAIISSTEVAYLKGAQLRGSLLHEQDEAEEGAVGCVFTKFYVDHEEPLQARKIWEEKHDMAWPLGVLPEGHEFLCISRASSNE
ncbi:hypothetical protein DFH06DRAFT_1079398 [Mycena polygramma]|nr:hypothetical protein DFH06DRAFT_1079398 [Mycena polygramma]